MAEGSSSQHEQNKAVFLGNLDFKTAEDDIRWESAFIIKVFCRAHDQIQSEICGSCILNLVLSWFVKKEKAILADPIRFDSDSETIGSFWCLNTQQGLDLDPDPQKMNAYPHSLVLNPRKNDGSECGKMIWNLSNLDSSNRRK